MQSVAHVWQLTPLPEVRAEARCYESSFHVAGAPKPIAPGSSKALFEAKPTTRHQKLSLKS